MMSKKFSVLCAMMLMMFLTGCFNIANIRSDFESIGWQQLGSSGGIIDDILEVFEDEGVVVHVSAFSDGMNYAVLLEFDTIAIMDEQLQSNAPLKLKISAFTDYDLKERNFLLIPIASDDSIVEMIISIFHGDFVQEETEKG